MNRIKIILMLKIIIIALVAIWFLKFLFYRSFISAVPINLQYKAIMFFNAVGDNNINIAKALLFSHPKILNAKETQYGSTPLHWAVDRGYHEMTMLLMDRGADIIAKDKYARTPLHCAVYNNDLDMVRLLLSMNAFVDSKDYLGNTPLLIAEKNKYTEILKLLNRYDKK